MSSKRPHFVMRLLKPSNVFVLLAELAVVFALGFLANGLRGSSKPEAPAAATEHDHGDSAAAQTWTCSMHPQIRKDGPGKCPICGMDLIPVSTGKGQMSGMRQLSVSPAARALMNVQSAPVERRYVSAEVRMVGKVDYDETRLKYITAWVSGRLDRLYVDYTGVEVKEGDHMVYIYSEELYAGQQELIEAVRAKREQKDKGAGAFFSTGGIDLLESAREKLRLWGMTPEQVAAVEQLDKPSVHMTIYSPMSGIVIEKLRQEGDRVRTGDRIYTVADLNDVWVKMDAYESDLVWLRYGQRVEFTTEAYPGEVFVGRIAFIDPVLNEKTRTVKVRVNVPNREGKLKPEMFTRAIVRAQVAAGGRVIDPDLAGKWISPMHPEIVKDEPGTCDICGMPLVRAETLNYVSPLGPDSAAPLVIPVSAALVTGTRAVVYVEMPAKPRGLETSYQGIAAAMEHNNAEHLRAAFGELLQVVSQPNPELRTEHSQTLWKAFAAKLAAFAKQGTEIQQAEAAQEIFNKITETMEQVREHFAPADEPTFEGREIVLGPRAGDYYLVMRGLQEGELVVTRGNFKIDSEIQIQAKPSMMTPGGGGGGGGHHHGGSEGTKKATGDEAGAGGMDLPVKVRRQLHQLVGARQELVAAAKGEDLLRIRERFSELLKLLEGIDPDSLSGHARMVWRELGMLLENDAYEGSEAADLTAARRIIESFQGNVARLDQQFGLSQGAPLPQRYDVPKEFQAQLAGLWEAYLQAGNALAGDQFEQAKAAIGQLGQALAGVDMKLLTDGQTHVAWMKEMANLKKIVTAAGAAKDLIAMREQFAPLSGEIQVLALQFGFGPQHDVYLLHCPMAFNNQGANWLQKDDDTRNPYFGTTMLKCADRKELIAGGEEGEADGDHTGHKP